MKILLFGSSGQVGWELQRSLAPLGELVALDSAGRAALCGDFLDAEGVARAVRLGAWSQGISRMMHEILRTAAP